MLFESILSGGFAGAAVVVFLSKLWINSQLEKSLRQYQHDLDRKKDALQTELAVYAESAKLRIADHRQKAVSALEAVYGALVHTSLPRHGFKRIGNKLERLEGNDQINSKYFDLFSQNFQAFDRAFKSVTQAFALLEEKSIYLDGEMEARAVATLSSVLACYQKWHAQLKDAHGSAQSLFTHGSLNEQTRSMNFDAFHASMVADWSAITGPIRSNLKAKVRELLTPQEVSSPHAVQAT